MGGFIEVLNKFADYRDHARPAISQATVAVTEKYARKKLGIKKDAPLEYRGLSLRCVGSARWRQRQDELRDDERFLNSQSAKGDVT